ncbi:MAG: TldD/PmbA family protein [Firmicutes bacterium]|nr:TldD/PmbA family protein [[Eubacterium] siraeum]MCM1488430.1 TldD/PmbA family protein [Bacillota bacterium]
MKVKKSEYLEKIRPTAQKLVSLLCGKYDYCSLLGVDSESTAYRVSSSGISIMPSASQNKRGFVIRIFDKSGQAEYSFNQLTEELIPHIVKMVDEAVRLFEGESIGIPEDKPLSFDKSSDYGIDPKELGEEKIVERLTSVRKAALSKNGKIIDCVCGFSYRKYSNIFISRNRNLTQNLMWANAMVGAVGKDGDNIQQGYKGYSAAGGAEVLDTLEEGAEIAVKTTLELLSAEPIAPGRYECICEPEVTGMIVHEAFGHGVEMDMFAKDRALAKNYIGKQVASPLVTMHDSPCAVSQTASYFFDDEGEEAHDTLVIDKGILKGGFCDAKSALWLDFHSTGNGRRESYERKAYTRMTNTYFLGGKDKVEDMIASVKDGFLLSCPSSGMEDPKNWGIQMMVSMAKEIKDGKLTGKIYAPIVMTGYVPDLLKSITMMSENVELCGTGMCGKGYKEWVKVSDGGPYIKATISLG